MTTFDRVKTLADKQHISIVELEEKLNFGRNSLYSWKNKKPNSANLEKVADFFGVTTDYLLGRNDTPMNATQYEVAQLDKILNNDAQLTYASETVTDEDREAINNMIIAYYWSKGRKNLRNPHEQSED